jgi:hypothetical protein
VNSGTSGEPKNFAELFIFYNDFVKILYSSVQIENALPVELLFEINAALDHISRRWTYHEEEEQVVARAFGHFKRACLDVFKIKLRDTRKQYDELLKIDTGVIDNGEFDRELRQLWYGISTQAINARRLEGRTAKNDETVPHFELWKEVFDQCDRLEKDFYLNKNIEWAKKRASRHSWSKWLLGL